MNTVSKVCRDHGQRTREGLCAQCILLLSKPVNHRAMMRAFKHAQHILSSNGYYDRDDWEMVEFKNNHAVNLN